MGLFTTLLTLPAAPLRGVIKLGEVLEREADRQLRDPARVRAELAAVDESYAAGRLTAEERDRYQDELVARLLPPGAGGLR